LDLTLRTCKLQDLGWIDAIEKASFSDPYRMFDFLTYLRLQGTSFIVACVDNSVVGYVIAIREGSGTGVIQSVAVLPEFRKRGIGRKLMESAIDFLADCDRVMLFARRTNEAAAQLYRNLSFRETGRVIERYYRDGEDALEFELILSDD